MSYIDYKMQKVASGGLIAEGLNAVTNFFQSASVYLLG